MIDRRLLAGAGGILAAGILAAPAQAAFPGNNGVVVYERTSLDVFLSSNARSYQSFPFIPSSLYTSDGSTEKPLVEIGEGGMPFDAAVSADGKQVAYTLWTAGGLRRIHVIGIDGSGDRELVPGGEEQQSAPTWSPDGTQIAWVQGDPEREADSLWVANTDGTGTPHTISLGEFGDYVDNPQWSPDGKWIAFDSDGRIYVVPATGGETRHLLADWNGGGSEPNWAPDGSAIAFVGDSQDSRGIYEAPVKDGKLDGTVVPLVGGSNVDGPAYSPDGLKVIFSDIPMEIPTSARTRRLQGRFISGSLYTIPAAGGTEPTRYLPESDDLAFRPDWQPIPKPKPVDQPKPPVVVVTNPDGGGVKGVSDYVCGSRRSFVIRLRPRGAKILMARVLVNGKRVKAKRGKRWTAHVDLRTLPKKRYKVEVTVWTKDGRRYHEVRRYWTCTPAIVHHKRKR